MALEFYKSFVGLLLPAELPLQLEFLKIIVYILGFLFITTIVLYPFIFVVNFYKNRRFN